jgi:hypothetical protein
VNQRHSCSRELSHIHHVSNSGENLVIGELGHIYFQNASTNVGLCCGSQYWYGIRRI